MRPFALAAAALAFVLPPIASVASGHDYARQVVELSMTCQGYEPQRPWARSAPVTRTAFGAVVEGNLVLTSAQMVGDATLIQVGKHGGARKAIGRVVQSDAEINLALVAVDEPRFFDDLRPVRLARRPVTDGTVSSVRWRGGQLDVSTSRVARAEVRPGPGGDLEQVYLLVKSDLGGGGWCEPVFDGRSLVGLTVAQDDDLARVLPSAAIAGYLGAVARHGARYPGFGALGMSWQPNRDPALAAYLGLKEAPRGVIVLKTAWGGSACGALRPRDILLSLNGNAIDAEGFYLHPDYGRLRFTAIATDGHLAGEALPAQVLRDGQVLDVSLRLRRYLPWARLVPPWRTDYAPPYVVAGGLVFRELDLGYLRSWGKDWRREADSRLMAYWELEQEAQRPGRRRIVILAYVLPAAYNIGYQNLSNVAVRSVNGKSIGSLRDLADALASPQGPFQTLVLQPNGVRDEIVLDAASFREQTRVILERYGIPAAERLDQEALPDLGTYCGGEAPPESTGRDAAPPSRQTLGVGSGPSPVFLQTR